MRIPENVGKHYVDPYIKVGHKSNLNLGAKSGEMDRAKRLEL